MWRRARDQLKHSSERLSSRGQLRVKATAQLWCRAIFLALIRLAIQEVKLLSPDYKGVEEEVRTRDVLVYLFAHSLRQVAIRDFLKRIEFYAKYAAWHKRACAINALVLSLAESINRLTTRRSVRTSNWSTWVAKLL